MPNKRKKLFGLLTHKERWHSRRGWLPTAGSGDYIDDFKAYAMRDAAELGARRVSVGGAFARAAWGGFIRSAKELIETGTFDELKHGASYDELQRLFVQR